MDRRFMKRLGFFVLGLLVLVGTFGRPGTAAAKGDWGPERAYLSE